MAATAAANIRNYSIHTARLPDGRDYLFSYFEYVGEDFEADSRKMAADPETQRWWALCKPLLEPVADLAPGAGLESAATMLASRLLETDAPCASGDFVLLATPRSLVENQADTSRRLRNST